MDGSVLCADDLYIIAQVDPFVNRFLKNKLKIFLLFFVGFSIEKLLFLWYNSDGMRLCREKGDVP